MSDLIFADWTDLEFAKANNEMNKKYFETDEYKKYESFFKIKEALNYILSEMPKLPLTMLDVGCGSGWQAEYLRREGFFNSINYTGLDISEHMCNFAKQNHPDLNFITENIVNGPLGSFDIVFEAAVLELIPEWQTALINIIKSSKKWVILHRLFFTENVTKIEQVVTYNEKPDIRFHIGLDELSEIFDKNNFHIVYNDIWSTNPYKMGYFIARKND